MTGPCDDAAPPVGAFAVSEDGARWSFAGGITFANAAAVLDATRALALPSSGHIDMAGFTAGDSSALAVLLALKRRAGAEHRELQVEGLPDNLTSLARVYGVDDLVDS